MAKREPMTGGKGKETAGYSPLHNDNPTAPGKASSRDYAGYGPTDGVQSEASTSEPRKYLAETEDNGNHRVRTGWSKGTRFTGKSNAG